jgi:ATP-dependent Zn protease
MITVALGGRVAEEMFFGKITTGASDDLKKCTQIAQGMVTQYGMVESLGTINYAQEQGYSKMFSEKTGALIDSEVKHIINNQYVECRRVLEENKDKIEM